MTSLLRSTPQKRAAIAIVLLASVAPACAQHATRAAESLVEPIKNVFWQPDQLAQGAWRSFALKSRASGMPWPASIWTRNPARTT
jgi:hypothetical protein